MKKDEFSLSFIGVKRRILMILIEKKGFSSLALERNSSVPWLKMNFESVGVADPVKLDNFFCRIRNRSKHHDPDTKSIW